MVDLGAWPREEGAGGGMAPDGHRISHMEVAWLATPTTGCGGVGVGV